MITRFRKLPIEIDAIQWTGDNIAECEAFAPGKWWTVEPEDRTEDPEITAEVYDELHSTWVGMHTGQWIIRGIRGEFYPINEDVLAETYEPVGDPT